MNRTKYSWLPGQLVTEYDRLYCQLLSYGDNITSHYEENEEVFFFFSRLYHLGQNIGFRSIIIDKSFFDLWPVMSLSNYRHGFPPCLRMGFVFNFRKMFLFLGILNVCGVFLSKTEFSLGEVLERINTCHLVRFSLPEILKPKIY